MLVATTPEAATTTSLVGVQAAATPLAPTTYYLDVFQV
jgi:hypothetical protein